MPAELPKEVGGGATAVIEVGVFRTTESAARDEGWKSTKLRPRNRSPAVFNASEQVEESFELHLSIAIISQYNGD